MNGIRRLKGEKGTFLLTDAPAQALVSRILLTIRVRVLERGKVVGSDSFKQDVILSGTLERDKTEPRLRPMDAVLALRVTGKLRMGYPGRCLRLPGYRRSKV